MLQYQRSFMLKILLWNYRLRAVYIISRYARQYWQQCVGAIQVFFLSVRVLYRIAEESNSRSGMSCESGRSGISSECDCRTFSRTRIAVTGGWPVAPEFQSRRLSRPPAMLPQGFVRMARRIPRSSWITQLNGATDAGAANVRSTRDETLSAMFRLLCNRHIVPQA